MIAPTARVSGPMRCSICGEMEYVCPRCGNQMPSKDGRFVFHYGGGLQWICAGSGEPSPPDPHLAHDCPDWDYMRIDDTMAEFSVCLCFKPPAEPTP